MSKKGKITQIIGAVVDVNFETDLPEIYTALETNNSGNKLILEVAQHLGENDVRTITQGRSEILENGDLFVEESNYGRTLYFNADGSLRWTHVNRANDGNVYPAGWSRILYTEEDIQTVNKFLNNRGTCNE